MEPQKKLMMDLNDYQIKFLNKYFCDLKLLKVREGIVEKWEDTIYGIPIPLAIRIIANYRTSKKLEETTFKEFLEVWSKEFKIIDKEIWILKDSQMK